MPAARRYQPCARLTCRAGGPDVPAPVLRSPVDAGRPEVAVDGAVQPLLGAALLPGRQLAVESRHVEQHRGLLKGDRPLAAGQARQRVVPGAGAGGGQGKGAVLGRCWSGVREVS